MAIDSLIQQDMRQERIQSFAFIISGCVCVLLASCLVVLSLGGFDQSEGIDLESRINPNDAPVGSLVRLPGIGIVRAGSIVAYRKDSGVKDGGEPAFENCDDLQKVRGIGPKTAENMREWLRFE